MISIYLLLDFLLQKRYRLEGSMDCLIRCSVLFFDLHPFSPSCVPIRNFLCKVSFWRFKLPHEPGLTKAKKNFTLHYFFTFCYYRTQRLFASANAVWKHRKNRKGTPGFERNAIFKKILHSWSWEKSLDSRTLPEYV